MGTCEILSLKQFQNGLKTSVSLNATEREYFLNVSEFMAPIFSNPEI